MLERKSIGSLLVIVILIVSSFYLASMLKGYGEERYAEGFDTGALLVINQLVDGKNISYTSLSGQEFYIQLNADAPIQYVDKEESPVCQGCHKYSTKYLKEGGA